MPPEADPPVTPPADPPVVVDPPAAPVTPPPADPPPPVDPPAPDALDAAATAAELARARKEAATYREKLRKHEEADEAARLAGLSQLEQAQEAAATARAAADAADKRSRTVAAEAAIALAASAATFADPADAVTFLTSQVEFDDDGRPVNVDTLVKQLAAAKPHLIKRAAPGGHGAPNPARRSDGVSQEEHDQRLLRETLAPTGAPPYFATLRDHQP